MKKSNTKKFLIAASTLDAITSLAYLVLLVAFFIIGASAFVQSSNPSEDNAEAFGKGLVAVLGVVMILGGVVATVAFVFSTISAVLSFTACKRTPAEILDRRKQIVASAVLNFVAVVFFIALVFYSGLVMNKFAVWIAVALVMIAIKVSCGVLKLKSLQSAKSETEEEKQTETENCL